MRVVIIGNGIAGITAARHIRKNSDAEIYVISGESKYFFSRTALMYIYMGHMKFEHTQPYENWFWKKNKINLVEAWVDFIDTEHRLVTLKSGDIIRYDKLVLGTGSKPMQLDIPGSNLQGVQSLYSKQDLELMEANTRDIKSAIVVGGGLIGVEMAEMLHSRGIEVTMIVRENNFWDVVLPQEESEMVTRHILSRGIKLHLNTTVKEIEGPGRVEKVVLSNGEVLETGFVGITIGVQPNIDLVKSTGVEINRGILVDRYLQTSVANIYAIGDCAELRAPESGRRPIEPVWYTGRLMGEAVASTITGSPEEYNPGLWFNSAKFFDLEYQTYGTVPNELEKNIKNYYWQDTRKEKALRLVANADEEIIGINTLGLRLKQEVCEAWIKSKLKVEEAKTRLDEIDFNAEFSAGLNKLVTEEYAL